MNFFEFANITFQNKSFENVKNYSPKTDGELKALHKLIGWQVSWFKFWSFFYLAAKFVALKAGFALEPKNLVPHQQAKAALPPQPGKLEIVPPPTDAA
jgi:hypothetical protein